jgi:hypothetical protein
MAMGVHEIKSTTSKLCLEGGEDVIMVLLIAAAMVAWS